MVRDSATCERAKGRDVQTSRPIGYALRWRVIGAARAASAVVQSSPLGRTSVAERLRARNPCMSAPTVLEVLGLLATAGVEGWVAGGWGIDALVGRETRRHYDLDIVIDNARTDYHKVAEILALADFRLHAEYVYPEEPMDRRYEWINAARQIVVDILPVDFRLQPFSRPGECVLDSSADLPYAIGSIDGQPVPCLSAKLQLELHSGYPPRFKDRKDIELLRNAGQGTAR